MDIIDSTNTILITNSLGQGSTQQESSVVLLGFRTLLQGQSSCRPRDTASPNRRCQQPAVGTRIRHESRGLDPGFWDLGGGWDWLWPVLGAGPGYLGRLDLGSGGLTADSGGWGLGCGRRLTLGTCGGWCWGLDAWTAALGLVLGSGFWVLGGWCVDRLDAGSRFWYEHRNPGDVEARRTTYSSRGLTPG